MREVVEISARLFKTRDNLRSLWGERYGPRIHPWADGLRHKASREGRPVLEVAAEVAKVVAADRGGMAALVVLAAAVEAIEMEDLEDLLRGAGAGPT